ncbi:MAG: glycosyltransferase family 4 protein [Myxococcota bacterium]
MEDLADRWGALLVLTGMPHPTRSDRVCVEAATPYDRRSLETRAASWLKFAGRAAWRVARLRDRPFVLAVTNPPVLPHLAWLARRLRGLPYGLLIWDVYPEHIVKMGWMSERHPVVRTWSALNRRALLGAEVVITLGDRMARAMKADLGPDADRVRFETIPNWADTDAIRPIPKEDNPFAREHGQVGRTTVMYSGNMGASHGLETLTEAARRLRDRDDLRFLFIGDGLGRAAVEDKVAAHRLDDVTLLPFQPWEVLPRSAATAEVAVVTQAPDTEHLSVPSKTYTALAAGSAILALTSEESDLADLVREHDVGVVCPRDDADAATRAIDGLTSDPERLATLRANARRVAETHFSPAALRRRFGEVLGPLIAREEAA